MQGLLAYTIRRLLWMPVILLVVSFLTFTITRFGPGDPVTILAGQHRDPETIERIQRERGLDKPPVPVTTSSDLPFIEFHLPEADVSTDFPFLDLQPTEQYGIYMKNILTDWDFGESVTINRGADVWDLIWPKMLVSIQPGFVALVIAFSVGTAVGIFAALRQGTWMDPFSISSFLFFQSIPVLVSLPFLVLIFVIKLDLLPIGWGGPRVDVGPQEIALGIFSTHIILPALVLSLPGIAGVARLVRATTLAVLGEDYVRTARAKGLSETTVVTQHVARNALLPLVTVIGLSLVTLLEGAFFTETILGIPGIGLLGFQAASTQDYDVILALVLMLATVFIAANMVIDIAYTFIDPRVRYDTQNTN